MDSSPTIKCRICGSSYMEAYSVKEMMFGLKDKFTYYNCRDCGCLQIENYIDNISDYYPSDYYSFEPIDYKGYLNISLKDRLRNYLLGQNHLCWSDVFSKLGKKTNILEKHISYLKLIKAKPSKSLLDVGCGNGGFLCELYKYGFRNLTGVDKFIQSDTIILNRINIYKKDLSEINSKFDIITMHHVFEHIPDQLNELKKAKKLLNKNGFLIIRIPVKAKAWELYKEDWVQIDSPRHYYIHTIKSMEVLSKKAGLQVDNVIFDSLSFQFWASEQYKMGISLFRNKDSYFVNKKLFSTIQISAWEEQAKELNKSKEGDQAIFILH